MKQVVVRLAAALGAVGVVASGVVVAGVRAAADPVPDRPIKVAGFREYGCSPGANNDVAPVGLVRFNIAAPAEGDQETDVRIHSVQYRLVQPRNKIFVRENPRIDFRDSGVLGGGGARTVMSKVEDVAFDPQLRTFVESPYIRRFDLASDTSPAPVFSGDGVVKIKFSFKLRTHMPIPGGSSLGESCTIILPTIRRLDGRVMNRIHIYGCMADNWGGEMRFWMPEAAAQASPEGPPPSDRSGRAVSIRRIEYRAVEYGTATHKAEMLARFDDSTPGIPKQTFSVDGTHKFRAWYSFDGGAYERPWPGGATVIGFRFRGGPEVPGPFRPACRMFLPGL